MIYGEADPTQKGKKGMRHISDLCAAGGRYAFLTQISYQVKSKLPHPPEPGVLDGQSFPHCIGDVCFRMFLRAGIEIPAII